MKFLQKTKSSKINDNFKIWLGFALFLSKTFNYVKFYVNKSDLFIYIPSNKLFQVMKFLKYDNFCQYKSLIDIVGVDYPERTFRFEVIYTMLSYTYNSRLNVITSLQSFAFLDSVHRLYNSSNWLEREVWDLFGIFFIGHPDLRRILTDYGFKGHALRKDFPLTGYNECLYDDFHDKLVYKEVSLVQEYRNFDNNL